MLAGHGEVGASRASALRAEHRVRLALAAEACRGFPAVEAVAPVAHDAAHIRFGEDIRDIAIDVARQRAPAERRSLGEPDAPLPGDVRRQERSDEHTSVLMSL